jgi:hypothetical protein
MLQIKAEDVYVEYMGRDVLAIDHLELYAYDRIGLVGAKKMGWRCRKRCTGFLPTSRHAIWIAKASTFS